MRRIRRGRGGRAVMRASEMRNFSKESLISAIASESLALNHSTALRELSGCSRVGVYFPAFDEAEGVPDLVAEVAAVFAEFLSKKMSLPAGAASMMPMRTPSAP